MKKILVPFFLFTLIFSTPVLAKEEAAPKPLPFDPLQGQATTAKLPLEFSLHQGKWAPANPGALFTEGYHAPDFVLPSLKETPTPIRYPRWAVREGWQGTFVIAVEVLATGKVGRWKVMESTGYPLLDEAAADAVRKWHFHPATEKGRFLVSCIEIPIHFTLQD